MMTCDQFRDIWDRCGTQDTLSERNAAADHAVACRTCRERVLAEFARDWNALEPHEKTAVVEAGKAQYERLQKFCDTDPEAT